jgi:hypothetical protein
MAESRVLDARTAAMDWVALQPASATAWAECRHVTRAPQTYLSAGTLGGRVAAQICPGSAGFVPTASLPFDVRTVAWGAAVDGSFSGEHGADLMAE